MHVFQSSEHNRSLDDLEEEDGHVQLSAEEGQEVVQGPPQAVRCGGEEGEAGGTLSQRRVDVSGSSSVRRGRGKVAPVWLSDWSSHHHRVFRSRSVPRFQVPRPRLWTSDALARQWRRRRGPPGGSRNTQRESEWADSRGAGQTAGRHAECPGEAAHSGGSNRQSGQTSRLCRSLISEQRTERWFWWPRLEPLDDKDKNVSQPLLMCCKLLLNETKATCCCFGASCDSLPSRCFGISFGPFMLRFWKYVAYGGGIQMFFNAAHSGQRRYCM